ncbi:Putative vacuolar membrane-associated protein Iml1 [Septoria linicola]|uniref:Vacuolar membrane-associated protein IML1 n=1 Tax=Septoria linicola TaxID=215465 RepID=A0A9Q9ENZ1_9PEZI|nr:putative vacuolar membrane-associated protein Iml1 [Septoria linicola]USW57137.1 Putative vacuolar membrane-associated protein Iml1 [Septoria linicola]
MAHDSLETTCTIVLHDDRVSIVDVLAGTRAMHVGEVAYLSAPGARTLCICPAGLATGTNEISLHTSLALKFGFENRTSGKIELIEDTDAATATHVEIFFRDQYLSRADMWQLMKCLEDTVMFEGQVLKYLGSTIADVEQIWIAGRNVSSGFVSHPYTKPIFRSRSARYSILIEVSREMLEGWSHGELMYERLIDDFLYELFQRWERSKARHLASVILFGRATGVDGMTKRDSHDGKHGEDFYILLVSEVTSITWTDILHKIKRAFNDLTLSRAVSLAAESNILEAIHLTAMDFADDQNDAHLMSTGTSIIAVTAGTGLFEADHTLLKQTTDLLVGNSIGVDIVALSPKPLHPVPLFKYDHDGTTEFALPHWVDISFWRNAHDVTPSSWTLPETEEPVHDIALPVLKDSGFGEVDTGVMDYHDNQVFGEELARSASLAKVPSLDPAMGSADTVRGLPQYDKPKKASPVKSRPVDIPAVDSNGTPSKAALYGAKRKRLPPHPLMQTGRKISLGPKGLAPSRGVASTTLSVEHAEKEKDINYAASLASITSSDKSTGLAKAFQASLRRKPSQQSMISQQFSEPDASHISRPIEIQAESHAHTPNKGRSEDSDELVKILERNMENTTVSKALQNDTSLSTTPKGASSFGRRTRHDSTHEALDMLSPWVMLLNPCNPRRDNMRVASQYRKWQHVFPRAVSTGSFKWSSMCSPAALPLTSEYKPSPAELEFYYRKQVKRHIISDSTGLKEESASILVERLIDVRLIRGFQIVAIRNSGGEQTVQSKGRPILLSLGRRYHEIQRISDFEVQIVQYEPKAGIGSEDTESQHYVTSYEPKMRTILGLNIKPEISYHAEAPLTDWTELDEHILRLAPLPDLNVTFKVRLVLLPVDISKTDYQNRLGGLSDEERRIEGIQRLTQLWQRQRYFSAEDQAHQVSVKKAASTPYTAERDPNPLAIDYQTRDTSVVVNAYGPTLSSQFEEDDLSASLFSEAEKHHSSNFDIVKLVKQMQEPPPFGVEVRDRRWLTVTHLKCFRGDEMTSWLLGVFKDLELREDAVNVGNELMSRGVFSHVRQRHKFRDGHYFYQISSAFRTTEYPDTTGLFSKAPWRSIPPTPIADSMKSPMMRPVSGISATDSSSSSDRGTPGFFPTEPRQIMLSSSMQFNVDPQKKSDHLQIMDLHYDRIHNPENCYHIQLEWLGTSTKLIREAIARWSSSVEGYGLKLMQVPLQEACKFREHHPYDQPQPVRLAVRPPDKVLATPLMEPHTFSPRMVEDPMAYHKRLLKKLDFVLDYEAANSFTTALDVRYSFGVPSYQYTQFVHKSGLVLAQVLANDIGDFYLLPNRLATSRLTATMRPTTETDRPDVTVDSVQKHFKAFCKNEEALRQFYREADRIRPPVAPSPLSNASVADLDVPPMQLPPLSGNHRAQLRGL